MAVLLNNNRPGSKFNQLRDVCDSLRQLQIAADDLLLA
jgi:hypothetical protein